MNTEDPPNTHFSYSKKDPNSGKDRIPRVGKIIQANRKKQFYSSQVVF